MLVQVRKIGNSSGVIIPAKQLRKLSLSDGDEVLLEEQEGKLVLTKNQPKPKYTLDDLIAKCDPDAPVSPELEEWDQVPAAGKEKI